ncbi:hypothetical protein RDABS01_023608 [Bienertia sinuspersici]
MVIRGIWRASGITSELQLYCTAIGALVFAALMLFAGWFHYHKAAPNWLVPRCRIYVESPFSRLLDLGLFLGQGIKSIFLTFRGGLDPVTGVCVDRYCSSYLAIAILFLIAVTCIERTGLTICIRCRLSISSTDYGTQLHCYTSMWIGGFLIVGAAAHAAIFMVRDYDPTTRYNDLLDRVLRHRDTSYHILTGHFWLVYSYDTMSALGRPQDMFSDTAIQLQPSSLNGYKHHALAPSATAPGATTSTKWVASSFVTYSIRDRGFLVHHIHAFTIHVTVLILLKGVLFARSSRLIPDKAILDFASLVMGRKGDMQVSAWIICLGSISDRGSNSYHWRKLCTSSITINGWLRDFYGRRHPVALLLSLELEHCTRTCCRSNPLPSGWNCHNMGISKVSQGLVRTHYSSYLVGIATAHDFGVMMILLRTSLSEFFASHFGH